MKHLIESKDVDIIVAIAKSTLNFMCDDWEKGIQGDFIGKE